MTRIPRGLKQQFDWNSYKSSSGFRNYNVRATDSITPPMDQMSTSYDNRYKFFETEAEANIEHNEEFRYTFPYKVKLHLSSGIVEEWLSDYTKKVEIDTKMAELGYVDVDFNNLDDAKKFRDRAKRVLGRMVAENVAKYHNTEAIPLITERARTQVWGDAQTGTEKRISEALNIPVVEAEQRQKMESS